MAARGTDAPRRKRSRAGRGTLIVIAGLLVASAMLRMGGDAGQVFARAAAPGDVTPPDAAEREARSCEPPEEMRAVLKAFQAREARIEARETAITDRLQALKLADREVARKLALLEQAEEDLRAMIALADGAAEGDIARLTKVYESMKPKDAAALFEEMNADFAAGFLGRMRPEAAAGIMAGLSPDAAHRFSVVLAGRNAGAPTE
ncbi:hypothetical protein D6850_16165 [Roseovarius spongiae]|uniref:Magnesium transporter MgtE intracellular domain-containing protein n=1 Tax=Roseovarius spongiae TaxID=2320272 RepID=A0A3A8AVD1_9RHOB|nr:hypothetical protein [Roseovarius spongiae]RKF13035.1 hypothetical protein D6850_16165 [Roseovarius spongiae]